MAKDPDQRYATTVELADAAREAITVPIARPAPTPAQPPTEPTPSPSLLLPTEQAHNLATAQPMTVRAESPAPVKPVARRNPRRPSRQGPAGSVGAPKSRSSLARLHL
jgi:serine/threonine-protein kinase